MILNTSRFGQVEVDQERVITFPNGLLGFSDDHRYVLLQPSDDGCFYWLQSVDTPGLAFVVTDPSLFVTDYTVPLRVEVMQELGVSTVEDAQVFVIVNRRGQTLTGNLQGPLVIHITRRIGQQLVLSDRRWDTRAPLMEIGATTTAASA